MAAKVLGYVSVTNGNIFSLFLKAVIDICVDR